MKQISYFILIILLSACGQNGKQTIQKTKNGLTITENGKGIFTIIEIQKEYFDKVKKRNKVRLNIDSTSIQKRNGQINLPVKNSKDSIIIFKDKINPKNEESEITYNYLGYYKQIGEYLIETNNYESSKYNLISKYGWKTNIWNVPVFSTDNKYFACFKPYGLEGEAVGIQIWKVKSGLETYKGLYKIFEMNQLLFNPVECLWDNNGLLIKAEKMENNFYPNDPSETYYLKLKIN